MKPECLIEKTPIGLVLWCFTPLSTKFQLYRGKPEYPEKTTTCRKSVTNFITQCCID